MNFWPLWPLDDPWGHIKYNFCSYPPMNDGRLATFTKSPHVYKLALLQSRHINANLPQIQTRHTFSYTVLWVNIWNNLWYIGISGRYQQSIEKLLAFGALHLWFVRTSPWVRRRCLPLFDGMIVGSAIDRRATPGLGPQCRHRLWSMMPRIEIPHVRFK